MILTGKQIQDENGKGLLISDFSPDRLNPNSYNLRLADEIAFYKAYPLTGRFMGNSELPLNRQPILDMAKENAIGTIKIGSDGYILKPGILYLARTMEYTETHKFVPMLEGRSSVGRLGISIHSTAGFGDIGFCGYWTLEISCVQPVRIYPGVEICQIYYHTIDNSPWNLHGLKTYENGKYQNNEGIQASMMWKEFNKKRTDKPIADSSTEYIEKMQRSINEDLRDLNNGMAIKCVAKSQES